MKLIYKGKYDGDASSLLNKQHREGGVAFKEMPINKLLIYANGFSIVILFLLFVLLYLYDEHFHLNIWGALVSILCIFPHEFLHAICFKETVYLYTYLSHGGLFVVGGEDMSKARFVFMSLLPNLVFGFIPFLLFFITKNAFFGTLGAFSISMGVGDYYNVFNALTQMPRKARTYLYEDRSYWYMPKEK